MGYVQVIFERKGQSVGGVDLSDQLGLVASMLPLPDASERAQQADDDDDDDDDETLRDIYLLVIRLIWVQVQSQLESMDQELELLRIAPLLESEQPQAKPHEDEAWRLDLPVNTNMGGSDGKGPLMDSRGRVSNRSAYE
jgi:immunoglobulin-binding protein 1